jgi:aldehyde:ferredoxin oxidoreductase
MQSCCSEDSIVVNFYNKVGTMGMADYQNYIGGLPVRNFSAGRQADDAAGETFKMGGDYIGELNTSRGGQQTHPCMPGCVIQCSNVYHDADGKEMVSPVEYETLGLLGTNCGVSDPDDLAQLNYIANDLGIDTIEARRHAGRADGGRAGSIRRRTVDGGGAGRDRLRHEQGRLWAQGTARVGAHYKREAHPRDQEAGDQRLRPARRRGDGHHDDGDGAGRRPHRRQSAAPQDP